MKKYFLMLALGLCVCAGTTSCSKDDDDAPQNVEPQPNVPAQPSAKTQLISAKPWKLAALTSNGQDFLNTPFIPACNRDDVYKFNTDSTLTVQDGALPCSQTTPSQGNWAFKNNETTVNLVIPSLSFVSGDFAMDSLSASTLILSRVQGTGTAAITFVATFKAQ